MALDPSQQAAVDLVKQGAGVVVITGGPGTGKTTTLREVLAALGDRGVGLCAPTGKAAKRLSEATGRPASTIHRLLGYTPDGFRHDEHDPVGYGVVIVDEASMIDVELFAALTAAIPPGGQLVLVGDANQLPSVGPGRVLADMVACGHVPVARLTTVHRSAAESWICQNAPRILAGTMIDCTPGEGFLRHDVGEPGHVPLKVCDIVAAEGGQVLAPQRTGACGVEALNKALQTRMNPPDPGKPEWLDFRDGDSVIHTQNNYQLGVFNGETGTIRIQAVGGEGVKAKTARRACVDFDDGRSIEYDPLSVRQLQLAYALTIHKSQGSEWQTVIVVCHSTHTFMLDRQLLYTAITRGKTRVVIVGNEGGLNTAIENGKPAPRLTALQERLGK